MITQAQIKDLALDYALKQVFVNVGDECWPDDPLLFLERSRDEEGFYSNDEMIPWEFFENEEADSLYDLVDGFADAFRMAVNEVLIIERG